MLVSVACITQSHAALLDPTDFTSLGAFNVTNGGYIIDTDALTIAETNASATNLLFTGVIHDQDGMADSFGPGGAVTTVGSNGIPHIAVFTFDGLVMDGTATFTVSGHRALALLSQGDALVNVGLSLDGEYESRPFDEPPAPGSGGPGGFAGGGPAGDGEGPGGGLGHYQPSLNQGAGGGGSFGGLGQLGDTPPPTPAYGDLGNLLQGGSGGGGADTFGFFMAAGGGGGGALELGAVGNLTIGSSAVLRANGGLGQITTGAYATGASGSGGGIRLHAGALIVDGIVQVQGGVEQRRGSGGRVLRAGDLSLPIYIVGSPPAPSGYITGIDVSSGLGAQFGWITAVPTTTTVPLGNSLELGDVTVLQTNSTSQPGVELLPGALSVEGTITVPTGGIVYRYPITLASGGALVTGSDPLTLGPAGKLSGAGTVQVDVINGDGGNIIAINDQLTFTGSISNQAGGEINVVSGTLTIPGDGNGATDDGIVSLGSLNLINAVVNGDVRSPSNSVVNVAGTATFNGHFKGAASFSGTQNLITFNGGYEPGDSPAAVQLDGSVAFGPGNSLIMELAGSTAGSQHDQLIVGGTATFDGTLNVVLIDGFTPMAGQVFQLFDAVTRVGSFSTVNLPALGAGLMWVDQIESDGSITVATLPAGPAFGTFLRSGGSLIIGGSGGTPSGSYVVLSSTNITTPLLNWDPVSTNLFDAGGAFLVTNPIHSATPQEFYRLVEP